MINCFWAYSDYPINVGEDIENAVTDINEVTNLEIYIETWKAMKIDGNFIIEKIKEKIDACDVFICELSNLNFNVLFELGYALSQEKTIRIFLNTRLKDVRKKFDTFGILTTIGYSDYINSTDLKQVIWQIIGSNEQCIVDKNKYFLGENKFNFFYIKSAYDTTASRALTRRIDECNMRLVVDDPEEIASNSMEWYVNNLLNSNGYIAHFLSEKYENDDIHNSRASLVSGMAYGYDIPMLMLVESPFVSPIDYRDIIKIYTTKNNCLEYFDRWFESSKKVLLDNPKFRKHTRDEMRAISALQNIDLGETLAENEEDKILEYFIKTNSFYEAMKYNLSIFIGRKGTGKTANLLNLASEFKKKKTNHVCVVKPIGYEIDGVLETLEKLTNAEKGFLIESIWKYLLYTEIIKSVYQEINTLPDYRQRSSVEEEILKYVKENEKIILPEFSIRLETVIDTLSKIDESHDGVSKYQLKVSELLHKQVLIKIRSLIGNYCEKKEKVVLLIDNLDKAWQAGSNIEVLSKFVFGLLEVGDYIIRDFSKENNRMKSVDLSLIVFLREDIFSLMDKYVPERDKLQIRRILWEDNETLLRVIEERFQAGENVDIGKNIFVKR